jgi:hypothetical protein
VSSLPGIGNTGTLLFLIMYVYSIIGIQLFSTAAWNDWGTNDLFNYTSFPLAFLSIIAIGTGDAGPGLMLGTTRSYSIEWQCVKNPTYEDYVANDFIPVGCGSGLGGIWFYYSYHVLVNMIFLNLVVGIIIEGFEETKTLEARLFKKELALRFQ